MNTLEGWLRNRPLVITFLLALAVSYATGADGIVAEDAMPFGDGERYVMRAMTLYGFLHTGQWAHFWDVFTLPKQTLAPVHYWLFFLLPQSWASLTSYGAIQAVTTYVILGWGVWELCRTLDRVAWAPAIFLLCATQNISIDYSFFYFADMPFTAVGTLALAWQMRAWRDDVWRSSMLSGFGAGLLFWIKPPNALIFAAVYALAEFIRVIFVWRSSAAFTWKQPSRHVAAIAVGFIPVSTPALACGGFQSIIRLIDANEVSDIFATRLECTGLLRFFYFPLCLTFFYHAIVMVVVFGAAGIAAWFLNRRKTGLAPVGPNRSTFPAQLLLPLVIAYFILCEFFSFGEASKGMRSILLVLPVMWLAIFWLLERCRMRLGLMMLAAMAYVACAYAQVFSDAFGTGDRPTEGYQLEGDWLGRLPQPHYLGPTRIVLTDMLVGLVRDKLPDGGKIAVGSEQLYLTSESLSWTALHEFALQGQPAPYDFQNFLTEDAKYCRSALLGSRMVLVFLHPSLQYNRPVYQASNDLVQFALRTWFKDGTVEMIPLRGDKAGLWGACLLFKQPLTNAQINDIIAGTKAAELSPLVEFNPPKDRRLTWQESWDTLIRWKQKRLGK